MLIVDDDPEVAGLIAESLESDSVRTVVAHDGRTGLRRAVESRPDLVLIDWLMPGLDGLQVCRSLRAQSDASLSRVPVVLMTGLSGSANISDGFAAGANDYLTKPFSPAYIRSRVDEWLTRSAQPYVQVVTEVARAGQ